VHYLILNDDVSLRIIGGAYPTTAARDEALPALIRRYPGLDASGADHAYWLRVGPEAVTIGQFTAGFMDVMRKLAGGRRLTPQDRRWLGNGTTVRKA
jgi:hypothetical protein